MLRQAALILASAACGALAAQEPPAPSDTLPVPATDAGAALSTPLDRRDTLDWRQRHSPKKAAILSAVVPGAGQVYNRKHWKAPIVWGGLGLSAWFIRENGRDHRRYKDAYLAMIDGDPATVDEFGGQYGPDQLLNVADTYRRWLDLSWIALGAVYVLNIVDASVDAHFVRFDVGPNLSLRAGPSLELASQGAAGLSLRLAVK